MQCAVVDGVKLNTSLLEFGERRSELRLILQRNAVDGAQAKLQPDRDRDAPLVSLPAASLASPARETSNRQE